MPGVPHAPLEHQAIAAGLRARRPPVRLRLTNATIRVLDRSAEALGPRVCLGAMAVPVANRGQWDGERDHRERWGGGRLAGWRAIYRIGRRRGNPSRRQLLEHCHRLLEFPVILLLQESLQQRERAR
jgi:hypothetical protein